MTLQQITAHLAVIAAGAFLTGSAVASSDKAWLELEAKMSEVCIKASDLDAAVITWSNLDFEAKTAALVTGKWRPKHMKGQKVTMLCLYDKHSGKAEVQEFDLILLK
nr:hypothetical protein [uncultured Dongia sp.]